MSGYDDGENREQALEHLTAAISYLRSCSRAEAESSARRCFELLSSWLRPPSQFPHLSLLDAKGYAGTVEESGFIYGF